MCQQINKHLLPTFADREFKSIRRSDITARLDHIEKDHGPSMADAVLAVFRSIASFHESRDDDYTSPIVKRMRRSNPRTANAIQVGLERRVARSGKDSIDHGPGGHDDVANSVAGVLTSMGVRKYRYDATMAWAGSLESIKNDQSPAAQRMSALVQMATTRGFEDDSNRQTRQNASNRLDGILQDGDTLRVPLRLMDAGNPALAQAAASADAIRRAEQFDMAQHPQSNRYGTRDQAAENAREARDARMRDVWKHSPSVTKNDATAIEQVAVVGAFGSRSNCRGSRPSNCKP